MREPVTKKDLQDVINILEKDKTMRLNHFEPLTLKYNEWNGFILDILRINETSLFGIHICRRFIIINLLFVDFRIFIK